MTSSAIFFFFFCLHFQQQLPGIFYKKGVIKSLAKFTGKHQYRASFLIQLQAHPKTLFKKRLERRCFHVNFAKSWTTPFTEHFRINATTFYSPWLVPRIIFNHVKREGIYATRSSRPEVFCKKDVLRNFAKSTGKHQCQSLFFQACNFIKKETLAQVFSCEFCEISKNTFFQRTPLVAASV